MDLHQALSVVAEGAALNASGPFGLSMLEQLGALIDGDYLAYVEFDFRTHDESFRADLRPIEWLPAIDEAVDALCACNPLREKSVGGAAEPLILSDFLSAYQRRRNPYYTEVLRPYQIEHQLKLFLPAPRGTSRGSRSTGGQAATSGSATVTCSRYCDPIGKTAATLARELPLGLPHRPRKHNHPARRYRSDEPTDRRPSHHLAGTVRTHLDHIYRKLDVHTRSAAVAATT